MDHIINHFLEQLTEISNKNGGKIFLEEAEDLVKNLTDNIKLYTSSENKDELYKEVLKIKEKLKQASVDMESLVPNKIAEEDIPIVTAELSEVTKAAENATNIIIDAAENIMAITSKIKEMEIVDTINTHATKILEACNFQDISGQRVSKVLKIFDDIDRLTNNLIHSFDIKDDPEVRKAKEKSLVNGPQLTKDKPSQEEIDDIFNQVDNKYL